MEPRLEHGHLRSWTEIRVHDELKSSVRAIELRRTRSHIQMASSVEWPRRIESTSRSSSNTNSRDEIRMELIKITTNKILSILSQSLFGLMVVGCLCRAATSWICSRSNKLWTMFAGGLFCRLIDRSINRSGRYQSSGTRLPAHLIDHSSRLGSKTFVSGTTDVGVSTLTNPTPRSLSKITRLEQIARSL